MKILNPEKLYVEFRPGVTGTHPIIPRRYTLTHSDITADLFLTVGPEYAYDRINNMRDEVLGEWMTNKDSYFLVIYVYLDGNYNSSLKGIRNEIFRRELPLALEAMIYGDRKLFDEHPKLNDVQIWVYFDSTDPNYKRFENWGTINDYI